MGGHAGGRAVGGGNRTSDRAGPNYGRVSRAALLASASLVALVMPGAAWAACTPSTRTISTGVTGPVLSNGESILVTGGGSIAGGAEGVFAENCSITTLSNKGAIGAASGAPGGAGGIGVLTNSGRTINLLSNATGATISGGKEGGGSASGLGGAGASNKGTRPQCIIGTQISDILDVTRTRLPDHAARVSGSRLSGRMPSTS